MTSSEFLEAKWVLEEEWNEPSKLDYYLARICEFILTSGMNVDLEKLKAMNLTTSTFILKFKEPGSKQEGPTDEELEEQRKEHQRNQALLAKAMVRARLGLNKKREKPEKGSSRERSKDLIFKVTGHVLPDRNPR